jgi:hypothetical protein
MRAAPPRRTCTGAWPRQATHRSPVRARRRLRRDRQRRSRMSGAGVWRRSGGSGAGPGTWRRRRTRARGCRARRSCRRGSGTPRRWSPQGASAPPPPVPAVASPPRRTTFLRLAGTLAQHSDGSCRPSEHAGEFPRIGPSGLTRREAEMAHAQHSGPV